MTYSSCMKCDNPDLNYFIALTYFIIYMLYLFTGCQVDMPHMDCISSHITHLSTQESGIFVMISTCITKRNANYINKVLPVW